MGARSRSGSSRRAPDLGELARRIADEVGKEFFVFVARILAVVLELLDGVEHLLLLGFGLAHDAGRLVLGILDGGRRLSVRRRDDLVGRALRDDEGLRDGVVVRLLRLKLALELCDALVLLGQSRLVGCGSLNARRLVEPVELPSSSWFSSWTI